MFSFLLRILARIRPDVDEAADSLTPSTSSTSTTITDFNVTDPRDDTSIVDAPEIDDVKHTKTRAIDDTRSPNMASPSPSPTPRDARAIVPSVSESDLFARANGKGKMNNDAATTIKAPAKPRRSKKKKPKSNKADATATATPGVDPALFQKLVVSAQIVVADNDKIAASAKALSNSLNDNVRDVFDAENSRKKMEAELNALTKQMKDMTAKCDNLVALRDRDLASQFRVADPVSRRAMVNEYHEYLTDHKEDDLAYFKEIVDMMETALEDGDFHEWTVEERSKFIDSLTLFCKAAKGMDDINIYPAVLRIVCRINCVTKDIASYLDELVIAGLKLDVTTVNSRVNFTQAGGKDLTDDELSRGSFVPYGRTDLALFFFMHPDTRAVTLVLGTDPRIDAFVRKFEASGRPRDPAMVAWMSEFEAFQRQAAQAAGVGPDSGPEAGTGAKGTTGVSSL